MHNVTGVVLVIDDERDICELVRLSLESLGFEVLTGFSGEAGLQVVQDRGNDIQLILLDLAMPGLNGVDVLAKIRKDHPNLPVIIMSGYVADKSEVSALGANDVLQKPFLLSDVENRVKQVLEVGH